MNREFAIAELVAKLRMARQACDSPPLAHDFSHNDKLPLPIDDMRRHRFDIAVLILRFVERCVQATAGRRTWSRIFVFLVCSPPESFDDLVLRWLRFNDRVRSMEFVVDFSPMP